MSLDTVSLKLKNLDLRQSAELLKVCSVGLLYPDEEWQKEMTQFSPIVPLRPLEKEKSTFLPLLKMGKEENLQAGSEIQSEHFRLFGSAALCPLELAFHLSDNPFEQARIMAQISAFYKAFGVEVEEGVRGDHLSVCLEFLSYLCIKVLYAQEKKKKEAVEVTQKAIESFIQEFLSPGLEAILKKLKEHSSHPFYSAILQWSYDEVLKICPKEEIQCTFI